MRSVLPPSVISVTKLFAIANFNFGELHRQTYFDLAGFSDRRAVPEAKLSSQTAQSTTTFAFSLTCSLTMAPIDEKILRIRQDLLRIQSHLFSLMSDVESLAAEIDPAPASAAVPPALGTPNPPGSFEHDILLYGQRRAARHLMGFAVNAGALLPRDALGFTIEQDPSDDESPDILSWRFPTVDPSHPAILVAPASSSSTATPTGSSSATNQAGQPTPRRSPRRVSEAQRKARMQAADYFAKSRQSKKPTKK